MTVEPSPAAVEGPATPAPPPRRRPTRPALVNGTILAGMVVLFELLAEVGALGPAVPPISAALLDVVGHWSDYWQHLQSTLLTAALGLACGTAVGVVGGIALSASRIAGSLSRGLLVVSYCAPSVVLLPILISAFSPTVTRLLVIVMMIAYPLASTVAVGTHRPVGLFGVVSATTSASPMAARRARSGNGPSGHGTVRIAAPAAAT